MIEQDRGPKPNVSSWVLGFLSGRPLLPHHKRSPALRLGHEHGSILPQIRHHVLHIHAEPQVLHTELERTHPALRFDARSDRNRAGRSRRNEDLELHAQFLI